MAETKDTQPVQIQLRIVSVKMKIKFPCKMALEYNKQPITKEVTSIEGNKFMFNQYITLRGETDGQTFEIVANLYTEKGTKYSSGVMKLLGGELMRSQGERLIIPLTKCLDSDSFCQVKVQHVSYITRSMLKIARRASNIINSPSQKADSVHDLIKISSEKFMLGETKSEMNTPVNLASVQIDQFRPREPAKTLILKSAAKSPSSKYANIKHIKSVHHQSNGVKGGSQFPGQVEEEASMRPSMAENDIIRESYQKLKQKYKKQSELTKQQTHKRMLLEANENNYKLEIMKLKLKCQSLEKQNNSKNDKIKQINTQLTDLQKKDIDLAYLKEQNLTLETKIKLHEETIASLSKDNDNIKIMLMEKGKAKDESIASLRNQLEFAMAKLEEQKHESQLQIKTKEAILVGKNSDLKLRTETIERQKQLIKELEDQAQDKLFDFEKSLSNERNQYQTKFEELKKQISSVENQKIELKNTTIFLEEQIQKQKNTLTVLQYNKKILIEETKSLNYKIGQFKVMKEAYGEMQRDYKLLEEQFSAVRKQLELSLQNKQVNINELMGKYDETKEKHEKSKTQYEQKVRSLILKTHELQLSIESTKSDLSKMQRVNESVVKDNQHLKKQNSNLRDQLKSAEKRVINLEGDPSSHSSRYERETANLTFLIQKFKSEKAVLEKENEGLKQKIDKLEQAKNEADRKEQQWKIRTRHFEEKIEKDANKAKQTNHKYDALIKEYESSTADLKVNIEELNTQVRELRAKVNHNDLQEIKNKERQERLKKQLKINSQRLANVEAQLKSRVEDLSNQSEKNRALDSKLMDSELQITKLKEDIIQEQNKSGKQVQIVELLNKTINKLNEQIADLHKVIQNQEKEQDSLRHEIKLCKEQITNEKIKGNKKNAQFQKFKESINDIIRIEFARILKTPPSTQKSQRLRQSQISSVKSERSETQRVKTILDPSVISSTLAEKLHETKNNLWKMIELNKAFKEQNNRLLEQFESETSKHEFTKIEMSRGIEMIEDEMNQLVNDKEAESLNYDNLLVEMTSRIKEKEQVIEDLRAEIQEYNAIINGFKTDFQTNNDLNDKKVNSLRSNINDLNERIDYLNLNVACLEDKNHELQQKVLENQAEIIEHKELIMKYEKTSIDAQSNEQAARNALQTLKKEHKALLETKAELEILLNTEKEMKEKYMSMLEEQEKKTTKQNQFIAGLMVQKESAVKNQLQKSEEVNNLQNKLFERSQQGQLIKEENQNLKKKIDDLREQIKVATRNIKTLEKQLSEEKNKNNRNSQKLKQKDNDINIKRQYIKDLEDQFRQLRDKNYKQIKELSNQLEDKSTFSFNLNKQLTEKIIKLQGQNKKVWQDNVALKSQLEQLNVELYQKNDLIEDLQIKVKKLEEQKGASQEQIASKQFIIHERNEQIQRLEQAYQQLKASYHDINQQLETYNKQFDINVEQMTNEYNFKLESLSKQHENKIELISKEYDYAVKKLKVLEEDYNTLALEKKSQEIEHEKVIAHNEERIKKLDKKLMSELHTKNNEIKQLSEQIKIHLFKVHEKESQTRKLSLELEQLKLSAGRSQQFSTYTLQQSKNREKLLIKEIESMKIKEQHSSNYRQNILNYLYQNEVEVRKILASTTKKIMQVCSKDNAQKIMTIVKGLEGNVAAAMMARVASNSE